MMGQEVSESDTESRQVDALVVGGGIAGLQAALNLAEQGFKVIVAERQPSIGGRMIALSKVFPTLDCASCITTPRMSATAHHPNIELMVNTEVEAIRPGRPWQTAELVVKATYVDAEKCTGCRSCEYACPIAYADPLEQQLGATKAIAVPFTNAIPQKAVLNSEYCIRCGICARACSTGAIRFDQQPRRVVIRAGAVVLASGFRLNDLTVKPQYNADKCPNVISPLAMERLLAPHGPFGRVLRPSDGKIPDNVAFVQCAGSRDKSIGVPYCSRVCCMYSAKQAMLLSGALPLADITIYYMDIRAFGKGYEQFCRTSKAMGVNYVRGKVARLTPAEGGDVIARVEMTESPGGPVVENRHDLVVLAQGMIPAWDPQAHCDAQVDGDGFVATPDPIQPACTHGEGLFVAGTASGPKDIVDTIVESGSAAMEASEYLHRLRSAAGDSLPGNKPSDQPATVSANHG